MRNLNEFEGRVKREERITLEKYWGILSENAPDEVLKSLNLGQEGRNNSKIIIEAGKENKNKNKATNKREGVGQDR